MFSISEARRRGSSRAVNNDNIIDQVLSAYVPPAVLDVGWDIYNNLKAGKGFTAKTSTKVVLGYMSSTVLSPYIGPLGYLPGYYAGQFLFG